MIVGRPYRRFNFIPSKQRGECGSYRIRPMRPRGVMVSCSLSDFSSIFNSGYDMTSPWEKASLGNSLEKFRDGVADAFSCFCVCLGRNVFRTLCGPWSSASGSAWNGTRSWSCSIAWNRPALCWILLRESPLSRNAA